MTGRNGTRVAITGMGAITPLGNSVSEFWQACVEGKSGIDYVTQFDATGYPSRIAGEVKGFDPQDYMDRRVARRMSRFSHRYSSINSQIRNTRSAKSAILKSSRNSSLLT
ncbi:MAG: beta-ketoacyl synthase N-terminal-like domain-containing protein, partial [Dehalococcoidia bacterium]